MLGAGFLPDVISSDVHAISIEGPAFDQLHTLSKFLSLGMSLADVVRASTVAPAAAVNRTGSAAWRRARSAMRLCSVSRRGNSSIATCWAKLARDGDNSMRAALW